MEFTATGNIFSAEILGFRHVPREKTAAPFAAVRHINDRLRRLAYRHGREAARDYGGGTGAKQKVPA
jgi:hypothetical protein